ncbi:MAG: glycosyltransferase [Anaerolineae bacterium]|nr:glycosyltransferase [Anaerolineae bacterium]
MRILVVLGSGGHTKEMIRLVDLLGEGYEYSYLIASDDVVSESKIQRPGPVFHALRPRFKDDPPWRVAWKTIVSGVQAARILRRVHPDVVMSAGAGLAVPVSVLAKLMGAHVIYVESAALMYRLTATGKIMAHVADLFFVQWPELQSQVPGAIYAGRLW